MPETMRSVVGHSFEHRARHYAEMTMRDPVSRHVVVDAIERILSGDAGASSLRYGELVLRCDEHQHPREDGGGR